MKQCCENRELKYLSMQKVDGWWCEYSVCVKCYADFMRDKDGVVKRYDIKEKKFL